MKGSAGLELVNPWGLTHEQDPGANISGKDRRRGDRLTQGEASAAPAHPAVECGQFGPPVGAIHAAAMWSHAL
jgi:hypothetical protein